MINLEHLLQLKIRMLIEGCHISSEFRPLALAYPKQVHLYKHSSEHVKDIPDDIIVHLGENSVIIRIRVNSQSKIKLDYAGGAYLLYDEVYDRRYDISFVNSMQVLHDSTQGVEIGKICSILGTDLVGLIPSNYCFYFGRKQECKFCEIWQTYNSDLRSMKAVKSNIQISTAIGKILSSNDDIRHLAVTSGNIKSYNYTAELFCSIGEKLQQIEQYSNLDNKLATLMPPDDFSIIDNIHKAGFNKIYFPIEIFEPDRFKEICPGKHKYGYSKMLDGLQYATEVFGVGNVYTNLVYGIQSDEGAQAESDACNTAIDKLLSLSIVPVFTIYHYSGSNQLGPRELDLDTTVNVFKSLGAKIFAKNILSVNSESVIFSKMSLSNTAYNESFLLAKTKGKEK